MKVIINEAASQRKLVAVIGATGGLFIPKISRGSIYISTNGQSTEHNESIEDMSMAFGRTPVYEGDSVTLQF